MKKLFILVLGALFALSFTVSAETVIYEFKPVQSDFSQAFYQRKAALGECDNFPCLVLAGNAQWSIKLNPTDFANRTIYLNYEYKTADITAANKNQGFKVMFVYTKDGRKTYCHRPPVSGNNDWSSMRQMIRVPDGITEVILTVSIPNGNAWIRKLYISGKASTVATPRGTVQHSQTLTVLKKKPVIDGLFTPDEWSECASDHVFISGSNGQKALRNTFVYYGYDQDFFYFCQLGDVPRQPQMLTPEDDLTLTLTLPGNKIFTFTIAAGDRHNLPEGTRQSTNIYGKLDIGNGFPSTGKWVWELAIPWSAMGLTGVPDGECRIAIQRNWKNPAENAVLNISTLKFSPDSPAASSQIALFGVNARVNGRVINPASDARIFNIDIMIRSTEVPHHLSKQITVAPNSSVDFSQYFMVGGAADRNIDIKITDEKSGVVIYSRNFDWNVANGLNFFNPDPPVLMNFGLNPSSNRLIAKVESSVAAKLADVEKIEFYITNADGVIIQKVPAEKRASGLYFKEWIYPQLPPGEYTLSADIFRKDGRKEVLHKTFRIMNFDWQNSEVGMARRVPTPFAALRYTGNEVHALLTGYRANGIFWDAVYSENKNILAAPVTLFFNGKQLQLQSEDWTERSADKAVRVSTHTTDDLEVQVCHEYEFDGMCKTTLKFKPAAGVKVRSLYIDIPLKPEYARLYHHTGFGIRSNPSDWIPSGTGVIWRLPWQPLRYPSYIWFGEIFKGFCYFTDMTPPLFDNQTGFSSHEILRYEDRVIMRIHLAPPGEHDFEAFDWICGFQATPVKPRPKGFRNYGGHFWLAKIPNMHMIYPVMWSKHFFSDISLGHPIVPFGNDHSWLEYIFSGQQDNESRDEIMARINTLLAKHNLTDQRWAELFGGTHDTSSLTTRMRQGAIFTRNKERGLYLNPRGGYRCWVESEMYDDEWMFSGYRNPDDSHYHRHPVKSYVDMMLFKARNFLRRYPGCSGIYFDNLYPSRMSSLFWGARELSPGKYSYTGDIFAMRELVKRTLIMSEEERRFLLSDPDYVWLIAHMTDANIVPVIGLLSVNLGWEMKFGRQDFQVRFPEVFHLVQSLGTQTGTVPIAIVSTSGNKAERLRQHRSLYAVGFAFDMLNFWDPGSREEDGSTLFNSMQFLVRNFGYGTDDVEHFPGYAPEKSPVTCSPSQVRITVLKHKDGRIMLLTGNLGKAAKVKLKFNGIKVSDLKNAENGKIIENGEFDLPEHDCAVLTGKWSN